jgi:hypothetical protein
MERPDDRYEAVLRGLLSVFAPQSDWETLPYEQVLRQLQACLTEALTASALEKPPGPTPDPDPDQAARTALGRLDPRAGDADLGYAEVLRRNQVLVDVELFRWTSAPLQEPGPSGAVAGAPPPAAPVEG